MFTQHFFNSEKSEEEISNLFNKFPPQQSVKRKNIITKTTTNCTYSS